MGVMKVRFRLCVEDGVVMLVCTVRDSSVRVFWPSPAECRASSMFCASVARTVVAGVLGRCTGLITPVVLFGGISNLGVPERLPLDLDLLLRPRAGTMVDSVSLTVCCSDSCWSPAGGFSDLSPETIRVLSLPTFFVISYPSSPLFSSLGSVIPRGGSSPVEVNGVVAALALVLMSCPSPSEPVTAGRLPSFIRGREAARRSLATDAARTSAAGLPLFSIFCNELIHVPIIEIMMARSRYRAQDSRVSAQSMPNGE